MEAIAKVLHGSYAYLLIFEIVLVASLSLIALSLLVRRIKTSMVQAVQEGEVPSETIEALRSQIESLERERIVLVQQASAVSVTGTQDKSDVKSNETIRTLTDKVKYLEAKLLEYEILQEEIGSLSTLKVENERLRESLVIFQKSGAVAARKSDPAVLEASVANREPATANSAAETSKADAEAMDSLLTEIGKDLLAKV